MAELIAGFEVSVALVWRLVVAMYMYTSIDDLG